LPSRHQTNESLRRYGSPSFCVPIAAAYSASSRSSPAIDAASSSLIPVSELDERACSVERLLDGVGARGRVSVEIAADPAAEAQRQPCVRETLAILGHEPRRDVEQALFEEPVSLPDLVAHARPLHAHLVRQPESGHLLGDRVRQLATPARGQVGRVELGEVAGDPQVGRQVRAPRRFGGVRRQDELERDLRSDVLDTGRAQLRERRLERLARRPLFAFVLAPAAHAMVLLGDVRELEVHRERAQHLALAVEVERANRVVQLVPRRALPGRPGEGADPLLADEELLALLLDENTAEDVAQQPDVRAQRRVGAHAGRR
jgi:hypothetical protein